MSRNTMFSKIQYGTAEHSAVSLVAPARVSILPEIITACSAERFFLIITSLELLCSLPTQQPLWTFLACQDGLVSLADHWCACIPFYACSAKFRSQISLCHCFNWLRCWVERCDPIAISAAVLFFAVWRNSFANFFVMDTELLPTPIFAHFLVTCLWELSGAIAV